jgi:hypothetical protein
MTLSQSPLDHLMVDDLTSRRLSLGHLQVPEQLELVHEGLVHLDIEEHGGAATVVREDDGALGLMDLCEHGRSAGTELCDRPDIC